MDAATAVTLGDDPASNPAQAASATSPVIKSEAASQSPAVAAGISKPGNESPAPGSASKPGDASPAPTAPPAQPASPAVTPSVQAASASGGAKQPDTDGALAAAADEGESAAMQVDATGQTAAASSTAAAAGSTAAAAGSTAQPMEQPSPATAAEPAVVKQEEGAAMEGSHMAVDEKTAKDMPAALVCAFIL